jgi:hypothetical protein
MRVPRLSAALLLLLPSAGLAAFAAGPPGVPAPSATTASHGATAHGMAAVSYRADIEPFLKAECTGCHSAAAHASGLNLETPEGLFKGGAKIGAKIVVPGKSSESLLIAYLRGARQPRMPMGGQPAPETRIRQVATWIDSGARIDAEKPVWPYTRPVAHTLPHVKNAAWCRTPIDRFVLAKLEARGLKPSPPADKITLLRRVYADIVGVPPTPAEASAFLNDSSPTAYEKLVDRLLADPRYGERWARHWLDLVRYADTQGYENDGVRPHAWRYRDYVIRAFNADKPYDRFLKEQIAGDELYPNDPDAITATGYIRLSPWDELSTDPNQRWQDALDDVTDTTGSAMLGLTVGCARCHNHKYDRITQADYYRMEAFFTPIKWVETSLPHPETEPAAYRQKLQDAQTHLDALRAQLATLRAKYRPEAEAKRRKEAQPGAKIEVNDDDLDNAVRSHEGGLLDRLRGDIDEWERTRRPYEPVAEAVSEGGTRAPVTHLLLRGNLASPGVEVQPGFIASLSGGEKPAVVTPPDGGRTTGRRSALAAWIASPDNPMTARVIVNRLWQHHFGVGLVATPSDFGRNGDPPTHPELLDWLATHFVESVERQALSVEKQSQGSIECQALSVKEWAQKANENQDHSTLNTQRSTLSSSFACGWSLKKLHRMMLLSSTYRQSSQTDPVGQKLDPTNRLLWRMNRIRLEGEALRDSILTVSGRLNPAMGGPGVYPHVSDEVLSTGSTHKWGSSPEAEGLRRTIYVFQRRSLMLPIVETFDGPDMNNTCPRRSATTIAPQALALFNGEFSREEARHFADRVAADAGADPSKQVARAYEIAVIRRPTPAQLALALQFLRDQTRRHLQDARQPQGNKNTTSNENAARQAALADFCHVLINTNEFLYLD